jgi:hypothetical protein
MGGVALGCQNGFVQIADTHPNRSDTPTCKNCGTSPAAKVSRPAGSLTQQKWEYLVIAGITVISGGSRLYQIEVQFATPEDFARAIMVGTIAAARAAIGQPRLTRETEQELTDAAAQLHPDLVPALTNLLDLIRRGPGYSALLTATMRFPAQVSQALDLPLLWMLDEFTVGAAALRFLGDR